MKFVRKTATAARQPFRIIDEETNPQQAGNICRILPAQSSTLNLKFSDGLPQHRKIEMQDRQVIAGNPGSKKAALPAGNSQILHPQTAFVITVLGTNGGILPQPVLEHGNIVATLKFKPYFFSARVIHRIQPHVQAIVDEI